MKTQEIKQALLNGQQFTNEVSNWYSVCNPSKNLFWIVLGDKNLFYNNIDSLSRKISQLLKKGC